MINSAIKSLVCVTVFAAFACSESQEAPTVPRTIQVAGAGLDAVTTNLGYDVRLTRARMTIEGLTFTRQLMLAQRSALSWLIGTAHAHPGHDGGGQVIGELPGQFAIDWLADGRELGTAALLEGGFDGARFALVGDVELAGIATQDGDEFPFDVTITFDEATLVEGIPPVDGVADRAIWQLTLAVRDPFEGKTLFDGIDFRAADLTPGGADRNRLLRAVRSHDHYFISGTEQ